MAKKNQLFKINPDFKIINSLLEAFGLSDLEDTRYFTKQNMIDSQTVSKINDFKDTLNEYCLPCKSKIYLCNLNEKKCITILRQFIKSFHYKCIGIEKSFNGQKSMTYRLIYNDKQQLSPAKLNEKREYIINFDM